MTAVPAALAGRDQRRRQVWIIAAVGAFVAATAGAEPTGLPVWDQVLTAALAFVTIVAISNAKRWAVIVFASIAAAFVGVTFWLLAAVVGLGIAIASGLLGNRDRRLNAVAGAFSIQALLRMPAIGFFGASSLIAAAAILLVLVSGYSMADKMTRKVARRSAVVIGVVAVALLIVGGLTALETRGEVNRGVRAARNGLAAARSADTDQLVRELAVAEEALLTASSRLDSPLMKPLRLLPVVSQNYQVASASAEQAAVVARTAADAVNKTDLSSITASIGGVDLDAFTAMGPELRRTVDQLEIALATIRDEDSLWLLSPLRRQVDEFTEEIERALDESQLAVQASEVLPGMLGRDIPRRYLIMFGTPAESREMGGLLGSWALIEANNGQLRTVEIKRIGRLRALARSNTINAELYPPWFLEIHRPQRFPQNLTGTPDPALAAQASRELLQGVGDGTLDGIIYIDAVALIEVLKLTGPLDVPFQEEPLSAANASQYFFEDQYRFEGTRTEEFTDLADVFEQLIETLRESSLPGPERIGRILGPVARGGHLQVVTYNDAENAFLERVKLQRSFARNEFLADELAIVQTNASISKLDLYLHRDIRYDAVVDETGVLTATATVTLRSAIPPNAPTYTLGRPEGQNEVLLSMYSPHQLLSAQVDGVDADLRTISEYGYFRYLVSVVLPANETRTVTFDVAGIVDTDAPYSLSVWHQPLVNRDQVTVTFRGPQGAIDTAIELVENTALVAE